MQGFTYIDLIILVVYLAAVLFAGLYFAKKEMKGKEYFKGDGTVREYPKVCVNLQTDVR